MADSDDKATLYFTAWHAIVAANLADDGYESRRWARIAEAAYNDGYTTDEYEEEWLSEMGLLDSDW